MSSIASLVKVKIAKKKKNLGFAGLFLFKKLRVNTTDMLNIRETNLVQLKFNFFFFTLIILTQKKL